MQFTERLNLILLMLFLTLAFCLLTVLNSFLCANFGTIFSQTGIYCKRRTLAMSLLLGIAFLDTALPILFLLAIHHKSWRGTRGPPQSQPSPSEEFKRGS